jgi:hypothetical protein
MARTSSLATRLQDKPGQVVSAITFRDLPPSTAAHALSRLAARGELIRVRRGHYYVPRASRFGPVPPDRLDVALSALGEVRYMPAGVTAANALGFTTQLPMGRADIISTRGRRLRRRGLEGLRILERSPVRRSLTLDENAFLEVLRDIQHLSDLSAGETRARAVQLVRDGVVSLDRMATAAWDEPPRVRAMLGALAEAVDAPAGVVERYREMVHPRSRYAFGPLRDLPRARSWGAQ